ncbi:MAG: hypothetical protein Q7K16_03310 [Candidatus Azambacteria bacterium]|nr:hypothetical protein [Candidatus Azambacteria bacterium]
MDGFKEEQFNKAVEEPVGPKETTKEATKIKEQEIENFSHDDQKKREVINTEQVWEYYRQAKEYEKLGMSFSRAMEMVVGKAESLHLKTETGVEIQIGPLAAIADAEKSTENELIKNFRESASHPTDSFESRTEQRTDSEAVLRFVADWITKNPDRLITLNIDDWKDLAPWQAILLASEIVNDSMEYSHESLDNKVLSEQLDQKGVHQLLEEGRGVCRHYAVVTKAVFDGIKHLQHSESLAGTEMQYVSVGESRTPTSIENTAFDVQKHAFNVVAIAREDGSVHVSVIDPTWADADGPQSPKEKAYDLEWQRNLDKFYTRAGMAVGLLIDRGLVNVATTENRNNLNQWLDKEKQSPPAILNFLAINFFKKIGPERYTNRKERDEVIIQLVNYLESARPSWKDENLQIVALLLESEAYRSLGWADEEMAHKRDAVWNELESKSATGQFNAEYLLRDPALRGLFLWKIYNIVDKGYDFSYERRNNLSFAPLNSLIRITEAMKPYLRDEKNHESFVLGQRLAKRMESIRTHIFQEFESFVSDSDRFLTQKDARSDIIKSFLDVESDDNRTKMMEQFAKSYFDSLILFRLEEGDKKKLLSLQEKVNTTIQELRNRWSEFEDIITAEREKPFI